ncbi:molybdopterin-guanine dinucleotide biosynthesis protein B [Brevibacillus parabrevis]|uniref:molybdopterin-guanine dinucleotide biosynthesis protein B n=1 Tax=Brevibacillus parabrevis TaxID=54914 RepID=UPI002E1A6179|nr:molybdopterin-guanine dinucleotide biosynthesis protein B [Brevibacillus parabrevis]MED1725953.1 molybdopterin-guanine dinucleotide biosynthesis protein B [Brevibacillus parabrevis]
MGERRRVLQIVGYSNSGKTTLLTRLIPLLEGTGLRVGVVKHDGGHDFEWDQPGKDTWRYREAGASLVAITSKTKTAMIEQRPLELPVLVQRLTEAKADLVLIEGFKREHFPKLVLLRRPEDEELLQSVSHLVGVVSWSADRKENVPCFHVDDVESIAKFVIERIQKDHPDEYKG